MANNSGKELPDIQTITSDTTASLEDLRNGKKFYNINIFSGGTLTLPKAEAGLQLAVRRGSASSGDDVNVQAAAGDTITGSDPGKKIVNETDAKSDWLHLLAKNDTDWELHFPVGSDFDVWIVDNA